MKKVSLVMIVKNEERYISRCLNSVKKVVDEMIVVDTGSSDKTKELARMSGAKVFDFEWIEDFSAARNYALSLATGDWILSLDADEYLRKNYRQAIQNHIQKGERIGRVKIISKFDDEGQVQEAAAYISRLFPKHIKFEGKIHEQLSTELPRVNVPIEVLHDGYFQTDKTDRNISLLEKELEENPDDSYYLYQLGKEYRNRKEYEIACSYFKKSYQLITKKEGHDANVIIEYLSSLNKSKQYRFGLEVIEHEEEFLKSHPDFYFNKGVLLLNYLSTVPEATMKDVEKIEKSFLKCLELGDNSKFESVIGTGSFLAAYNLGILYELFGMVKKAIFYYKISAQYKYQPAIDRIKSLN